MKKFISLLTAGILLSTANSCISGEENRNHEVATNSHLVDITLEGHTHQYLYFDGYYNHGPVDHWPDCKYCKEKNEKN